MSNGWNGKVLRVNLSERKIEVQELPEVFFRTYLGGSAFSIYHLLKELPPKTDPLGPENLLVLACSVITGAMMPGATRFTAAAKSPLTGAFGEAEAGGYWGPELKKAGLDAVIVKGKAAKPTYLWIRDGQAEIRDAAHLWGKTSGDAEDAIRAELKDDRIRVAQTGPGGEKLVRFANITNDLRHFNGRTGMGAVMGSKNLRAVAVRGTGKVPVADEEGLRNVMRWLRDNWKHQPGDLHDLGTPRLIRLLNADGILPTRNFRSGEFEHAMAIGGERMKETMLKGRGTCYGCPVACKREVEVPGKVERRYGGPEYETLGALGSCCCVKDLEAVALANQICGEHCIDTISTGACIAFAMECYENGILAKGETGGLDLRFGNAEAMVKLTEMIARREGLGDVLAEGVMRAAAKIGRGAERFAFHIKGQELPMHEPRGKRGNALSFATSPTGADHVESPHDVLFTNLDPKGNHPFGVYGLLEPLKPLDMSPKKVRAFCYGQLTWSLYNSLGMCNFAAAPMGPLSLEQIVNGVRAVTGWKTSLFELTKVAERANAMARVFNYREGFTKADDCLPSRLHEPLEGGPLKGVYIDKAEFQKFMELYYEAVGWDPKTGYPTQGKLAELGLDWLMDEQG
jgi:aldehyde:ferredoxin oxidoreductase